MPIILYCLMEYEPVRFKEMRRYLKKIADKTLSQNLTERGHSLVKVLDKLCDWGNENRM